MRILHSADVHLGRPFRGLEPKVVRAARVGLEGTFRRCLEAARELAVDLVTIGGDLREHEDVSADTTRPVAFERRRLDLPVLLIAANHDPAVSRSGSRSRGFSTQRLVRRRPVIFFSQDPALLELPAAACSDLRVIKLPTPARADRGR